MQTLARLARFRARDREKRIEGGEKSIGFLDRPLQGGFVSAGVAGAQGGFDAGAQAGQWRAQIMGDVARDFLHARHQALDLVEHLVEIDGKLVELIARAGDGKRVSTDRPP